MSLEAGPSHLPDVSQGPITAEPLVPARAILHQALHLRLEHGDHVDTFRVTVRRTSRSNKNPFTEFNAAVSVETLAYAGASPYRAPLILPVLSFDHPVEKFTSHLCLVPGPTP
jgi:hypothetical protein